MMNVLITIFLMGFSFSRFSGVFLFLVMFLYLTMNYSLFGADLIKGDLFGVLGSDYITFYMILLLLWIVSLVLILFYLFILFILVLFLLSMMLLMFFSLDWLNLFIYFESSMVPMFLIILFFGWYKERYLAGIYMFVYTMVSSLPVLIIFMFIDSCLGGLSIDYYLFNLLDIDVFILGVVMLMFLVKVPMFMVHIWLPKAHVEAPVFGSMILASIMLKMGGYGIIRCLDFSDVDLLISDFFFCLCLCGSVLISYSCLYQVDLKMLVAYSSIVHMGVMLMGFFSGSELGYFGGIIMMLSHGICSSGMFYLVNEIYKISGSRLLMLNTGMMSVAPVLIWLWLALLINNLGVPPCFGILGELFLVTGCLMYSFYMYVFFFIIVFFVSCFVMNMYSLLVGGLFLFRFIYVSVFTYYGGFMHLIPLNFFIFFVSVCL